MGESTVIAERLTAQLLAGRPARDALGVAERLLAVQAQDPRGARLAVRSRTAGLTAADVDRALTEERSLVITWLNRGTLHLVRSEDYAWLQALLTPPLLAANARRLAEEGVSRGAADRGVVAIERALTEEGPQTRAQLASLLQSARVRTEGQALVHILMLTCLRGIAVRGPMVGKQQAYALARDWLGEPPPIDREQALAELARRFLVGHGPADERDLAKWSGLPLRDARFGFQAIASEVVQRVDGLVVPKRFPKPAPLPPPRLLGSYDPVLHGWVSREPILGSDGAGIVTTNGLFRPFALVEGRAVATWSLRAGEIELSPFRRLPRAVTAALEADAAAVRLFLGGA